MTINPIYYSEDVKKIIQIEFSIFRNKDVESYSVVSNEPFGINLPESYENYEPKKGGLVDLRLGTCDIYLPCTTCGCNSFDCPGHFGHTKLAMPVFHFGFLSHLKNVLQCICLKCSKLLYEKCDRNKFKLKKYDVRFKDIKNLTKTINYCYHCGTPVPKIKREVKEAGTIKIIIEREFNVQEESMVNTKKTLRVSLSPQNCYNILRNVSDEDAEILGFNIKLFRPEDLIIDTFVIPPVIIRPTAKVDFLSSATSEDALTLKIGDIIIKNKQIRVQMEKETMGNELSSFNQDLFNLLQYHIAIYFDNESVNLPRTEFKTGNRIIKAISNRIKGKHGRVRSNLMGKRVDFSARTVITSDPYINIDQVGIPKKIAMELTIPEEVTPYNIKYLTGLVKNGRDIYPGANFVLRMNYLDGKNDVQKIDLKYRKKAIKLNYGDIVERHCVDNDYVLFNRQPTLHKPSMMGHKIQVIDNDDLNTFRMNVSVCKPYNADFDGDEMNIHLAQSIQAINELKLIANVQYQIVSVKDSSPIIGCQQDTLAGAYLLTTPEIKVKGWELANILCNTTSDSKYNIDLNKEYNGHEIFSHIIPKGINILKDIEIIDGNLIKGFLTKKALSFQKNSIIHFIWDKYGPIPTRKFIDDSQKLILNFLLLKGQTVGFKDTIIDNETHDTIQQIINNYVIESKYNITQFENDVEQSPLSIIESSLSNGLNIVQSNIGGLLGKYFKINNFFKLAQISGAKGLETNMAQVSGVIGQLNVEGVRIRKRVEDRSLIYFHKDDDTPEARGFIKSSFLSGLKGFEFFYNAMGGREGLIDTAIKSVTWETPIIIIENEYPIYTEIGKWIDSLLNKNNGNGTIQYIEKHKMELLDIKNVYIPTTDYYGNVSWGDVTAVTRHNPGINLYEIQTEGGRNVTVTESKSLLIWNEELKQFHEVLTTDIKVGDYVPVTSNLQQPPNILTHIYESEFKLNDNNGIFIGIFIANGTIICDNINIICDNIYIYNFIKKWFETKLINYSEIYINNKLNLIGVSETLANLLTKIIYENKYKNIPNEAFMASNDFICGLLNGYISCNGYINKSINIKSDHKRLLEGINMLFSRLGIFGNIYKINRLYNLKISNQWIKIFSEKINLLEEIKDKKIKNKKWYINKSLKMLNNIVFDKIVKINIISINKHPKVYDLTIPSTFNFGLANGLQVRDTAQTGYIQRQLIKCLEDLSIKYDGTNRNSKNMIIQIIYGENGINQATQTEVFLKILSMNNETLFTNLCLSDEHINKLDKIKIPKKELKEFNIFYFEKLKQLRDELRIIQSQSTLNYKILEEVYFLPVNLFRISQDYSKKKELIEDLSPLFIYEKLNELLNDHDLRLIIPLKHTDKYLKEDDKRMKFIFEIALFEFFSPKKCIFDYGLSKKDFENALTEIKNNFIKSIIEPGEMVGIIAAQSVGEPTSQFTLNTKHFAGVAKDTSVNMGVSRIQELLHYSKSIKTPQMIIYFTPPYCNDRILLNKIISYFKYLSIRELVTTIEIYYDLHTNDILKNDNVSGPFFINNQKTDINSLPFVFKLKLNIEKMIDKEITLLDIKTKIIAFWYKIFNNLKNVKKIEKEIINKITKCVILSNNMSDTEQIIHIRFNMISFNYNIILDFLKIILDDVILKGIEGINKIDVKYEPKISFNPTTGDIINEKEYVVFTSGINFEKLKLIKGIDVIRTKCNDINTILINYGIEAARQVLMNELALVYTNSSANINYNHLSVLVDQMCSTGDLISIDRHGMLKVDNDPIAKASFEKTMDHFINAAIFNEKDNIKSLSSSIAIGRVIPGGTGCFDLLLDSKKLENSEYTEDETGGRITFIPLEEEPLFNDILKYNIIKNNLFIPNELL
jgi:DNA-directed RNA polymerase beta' subunit